jgi:uncharacterized membrane protein YdcZ (DUF606 family)
METPSAWYVPFFAFFVSLVCPLFYSSTLPHRRMKLMDWLWIVLFIAAWLLISRFTGG